MFMVRCCGLTQHYFLEVRFHLSPFGSRFEDPFIGYFCGALFRILFWILLSSGPRHGPPTSGSVTQVTESQPPFAVLPGFDLAVLARVSRSARTAH